MEEINFNPDKMMEVMEKIQQDGKDGADFFDFLLIQVMGAKTAYDDGEREEVALRLKMLAEAGGVIADLAKDCAMQDVELPPEIPSPTLLKMPMPPPPGDGGGFKGFNKW